MCALSPPEHDLLDTVDIDIYAGFTGVELTASSRTGACLSYSFMYKGVRRSLVVTFAAIRPRGPRFKPRPGQKFETRFLFHAHFCSASGTTTSGTKASPKPAWKLTISK